MARFTVCILMLCSNGSPAQDAAEKNGTAAWRSSAALHSSAETTQAFEISKELMKNHAAAAPTIATTIAPARARGFGWFQGGPKASCPEVCLSHNRLAVSSGTDSLGFKFYVCAGFALNGDWRPGFNINTSEDSAGKCLYEYAGGRGESNIYRCLCQ
ncbi:hypothetical protein [Enhygromyxa salina]|uniref:hypothetical protein n=1 Tax=Enhygromyxa salina TaxID=215803 RepID=UPI0011BA63F7|nr:hypothetical protein [Enhygromyxa salina]